MLMTLQLVGAVLVLVAFIAVQRGWLPPSSKASLLLNLVGAATLAVLAFHGREWGFLLLEAVWALTSLTGLVALSGRERRSRQDRRERSAVA